MANYVDNLTEWVASIDDTIEANDLEIEMATKRIQLLTRLNANLSRQANRARAELIEEDEQ